MVMARYEQSKSLLAKDLATIIFPLILLLIPCGDVYTFKLKVFFATTVMAILCFAFENVNQTAVALLLPSFWVISGIAQASVAFNPWTTYIPWSMLAGLALAAVLESTGLLQRASYWIIAKVGGTYNKVLIAIAIIGIGGSLLVGDVSIPLAALCFGLCQALDLKLSKEAAGIMLVGAMSSLMPYTVMFNTVLLPLGMASDLLGENAHLWGYFEALWNNLPRFLEMAICVVVAMLIFKPSQPISGKAYFGAKLKEMGKMNVGEKKTAALVIFYFIFLASKGFNGLVSVEWGMVFIPLLTICPVIGAGTNTDIRGISFNFVIFVSTCMAIGTVAVSLGISDIVVNLVLPYLEGKGTMFFFIVEWVACVLANFVMTPMAIKAAFSIPFTVLAQGLDINHMAVYYIMNEACDQIIFPYEYALYLIYFAFGVVKMSDFMKMMGIKMAISFVMTFGVVIPWWYFVGVL